MLKRLVAVVVLVAVPAVFIAANPAGADHDNVFAPCDPADTRPLGEQVYYIDYQSGDMLRFDDPWWGEIPGLAGYTNWRHQCRLGLTGVWQAAPILPHDHPPTYVVETRYDLFSAEYEGWPAKETTDLLAERYPAGAPGKRHFPLSAAVEFLRAGGKVGGLDFLWDSAP